MQRLYHHEGDKASARAAEKFGTFYSMSTMANILPLKRYPMTFLMVQNYFSLYVHKDQSITDDLIDRCRKSEFDGMCLTVDTLVAGNREKDHQNRFYNATKINPSKSNEFCYSDLFGYSITLIHKKFELANVSK